MMGNQWISRLLTYFILILIINYSILEASIQILQNPPKYSAEPVFLRNFHEWENAFKPQHIHLAFAGKDYGNGVGGNGMSITWTTTKLAEDAHLIYGTQIGQLDSFQTPVIRYYYHEKNYTLYNYNVKLTNLSHNEMYHYQIGSKKVFQSPSSSSAHEELKEQAKTNTIFTYDMAQKYQLTQSPILKFHTSKRSSNEKNKQLDQYDEYDICIYGDLGDEKESQMTIKQLSKIHNQFDFILHLGDIAYADNSFLHFLSYEEKYNGWMKNMEEVMSTTPYMVVPGNHEAECHSPICVLSKHKKDHLGNFSAYNTRFDMPSYESNGVLNMWYSFDHGPIHFIITSTETDFPGHPSNSYTLTHKHGPFGNQLKWLEEDLKKAQEQRNIRPWIIVSGHRPIYSLSNKIDKNGLPRDATCKALQNAFEDLFYKYQVDIIFSGHEHCYERNSPIYKGKAYYDGGNEKKNEFTNPKAPMYIVQGAAGNMEGHKSFSISKSLLPSWHVHLNNKDYGYGVLKVKKNSLLWAFHSSEDNRVLDQCMLIKE